MFFEGQQCLISLHGHSTQNSAIDCCSKKIAVTSSGTDWAFKSNNKIMLLTVLLTLPPIAWLRALNNCPKRCFGMCGVAAQNTLMISFASKCASATIAGTIFCTACWITQKLYESSRRMRLVPIKVKRGMMFSSAFCGAFLAMVEAQRIAWEWIWGLVLALRHCTRRSIGHWEGFYEVQD